MSGQRDGGRASLKQLAEGVGKSVETISNIERGHTLTGLETLERIAKALGTPIVYFLEGYRSGHRMSRRRAELQQSCSITLINSWVSQ